MAIGINFIKKVDIMASSFAVIWDKTNDAGYFSWSDCEIKIGVKNYKKDPTYTFSVLSHEIMELLFVMMGVRFINNRTGDNYLFNFDHQTFENLIQIHTSIMIKFIKQ